MSATVPGADAAGAADTFNGRNRIRSRAIRAVVAAVAASELRTRASVVGVELADEAGALALTVSAPIGVVSLTRMTGANARQPGQAEHTIRVDRATPVPVPDLSILERAAAAQQSIRTRVSELTGSTIATVNLRLTAARIERDERIR